MGRRATVRTGADGGRTTDKHNPFFQRIERAGIERQASAPAPIAPAVGAAVPTTADAVRARLGGWGWLPALILLSALGLVSAGYAMQAAQAERSGAMLFLWFGLLLIFSPVAFRMALPQALRRERIALAVWLGLALYLVKILRSPAGFTFHDEFPHYATAEMILRTQHLFGPNSLQGVSAYFPGLEVATSALATIGGLSIEAAGLIVIGAARLIASLAIYLLYEEISGSSRVAGIGSVLAITYPNYVFWSSQYSYESLALPVATLVLVVGLLRGRRDAPRAGLVVAGILLIAAVTVIHHVTSYFLVGALIAVFVFTRFGGPVVGRAERLLSRTPRLFARLAPRTLWTRPTEHTTRAHDWAPLALAAGAFVVIWLVIVSNEIVRYLEPHLARAAAGFVAIFSRTSAARQPFSSNTAVAPAAAWEQLVAFGSVLLILAVIPFGLIQVWRRYRNHGAALLFGAAALAYPLTLVLRLASGGSEIANRSWDFLFVAIGFVLAAGIAELWLTHSHTLPRAGVFATYATALLMGAVIVGTPSWARLPGPFLVGGDTRGLQPESYALADWMRETAGPDNRIIADYTNKWLLGSFGQQYSVTGESWVYVSPQLRTDQELAELVKRNVQFVVVDDRLTTQTPRTGHYFEPGEPGSPWSKPIAAAYLEKFDQAPCLSRVFDSGHITVYAVSAACAPGAAGDQAGGGE